MGVVAPDRAAMAPDKARAVIRDALRAWRTARDGGAPSQPAIHAALAPHGCGELTPAFDSLMRVCEDCLGRPLDAGADAGDASPDECLLVTLVEGAPCPHAERRPYCGRCDLLGHTACSARILMALSVQPVSFSRRPRNT